MGLGGLEPPTSPLSGVRSNHLSYRPNLNQTFIRFILLGPIALTLSLFLNQAIRVNSDRNGHVSFKEVIQPQVPLGLPCYDFTPVMNHTVVIVPPKVRLTTSGAIHSHGVTGGVYKARERIHRGILIHDY